MKERVSALYDGQAIASSGSSTTASPSASTGIFASPATREPATTRIRAEPYELTTAVDSAVPATNAPRNGRVPKGRAIRPHAIPADTAINHHERGTVRRSS